MTNGLTIGKNERKDNGDFLKLRVHEPEGQLAGLFWTSLDKRWISSRGSRLIRVVVPSCRCAVVMAGWAKMAGIADALATSQGVEFTGIAGAEACLPSAFFVLPGRSGITP